MLSLLILSFKRKKESKKEKNWLEISLLFKILWDNKGVQTCLSAWIHNETFHISETQWSMYSHTHGEDRGISHLQFTMFAVLHSHLCYQSIYFSIKFCHKEQCRINKADQFFIKSKHTVQYLDIQNLDFYKPNSYSVVCRVRFIIQYLCLPPNGYKEVLQTYTNVIPWHSYLH